MAFKVLTKQEDSNNLRLHLESFGIDQEDTGAITMRKYFLEAEPEKIKEAQKFYGLKE